MAQFPRRPVLLLTRPRVGSESFAAQFRHRFGGDWPIVISPLIEIEPLAAEIPMAEDLIFTSRNAVAALGQAGRGRRAWCVGARTAEAARKAGFRVRTGAGRAQDIVPMIIQARPHSVLHVRAEQVAFDLAKALVSAGIETKQVILYRQVARHLSARARAVLCGNLPVLVPVFSSNSAQHFVASLPPAHAPLYVAAISHAVADGLDPAICEALGVASSPDSAGVLDALARLLHAQMAG